MRHSLNPSSPFSRRTSAKDLNLEKLYYCTFYTVYVNSLRSEAYDTKLWAFRFTFISALPGVWPYLAGPKAQGAALCRTANTQFVFHLSTANALMLPDTMSC